MQTTDDDLIAFERNGAPPLPSPRMLGHVEHDGARIWHAAFGSGPAVILLHGGLGHAGNWSKQVPALVASGRTVIVIDSRGHGRSTRDAGLFSYARMAGDVLAVMDHLKIDKANLVGWSDGACTALILADRHPERVSGVFFFGAAASVGSVLDRIADQRRNFVLDCTDVPLIDSTAASVIDGLVRKAVTSGVQIYIAGLKQDMRRLLEARGLHAHLIFTNTAAEALERIASG